MKEESRFAESVNVPKVSDSPDDGPRQTIELANDSIVSNSDAMMRMFDDSPECEDKVDLDTARSEFYVWLKSWKLLRKARRKLKESREIDDLPVKKQPKNWISSVKHMDLVIDAIQEGRLVVDRSAGGVKLIHKLLEPMGKHEELTYKRASKLVQLRKLDEFGEGENFGTLQGMVSALSNVDIPQCSDMSAIDSDLVAAIFAFFF